MLFNREAAPDDHLLETPMYEDSRLLETLIRAKTSELQRLDQSIGRVESLDKDNATGIQKFLLTHACGIAVFDEAKSVADARSGEVAVQDVVVHAQAQLKALKEMPAFNCFNNDGVDWTEYAKLLTKMGAAKDKAKDCLFYSIEF